LQVLLLYSASKNGCAGWKLYCAPKGASRAQRVCS